MHIEYDEHIWTSPANAQAIVKIISQSLIRLLPEEEEYLEANAQEYIAKLKDLGCPVSSGSGAWKGSHDRGSGQVSIPLFCGSVRSFLPCCIFRVQRGHGAQRRHDRLPH